MLLAIVVTVPPAFVKDADQSNSRSDADVPLPAVRFSSVLLEKKLEPGFRVVYVAPPKSPAALPAVVTKSMAEYVSVVASKTKDPLTVPPPFMTTPVTAQVTGVALAVNAPASIASAIDPRILDFILPPAFDCAAVDPQNIEYTIFRPARRTPTNSRRKRRRGTETGSSL